MSKNPDWVQVVNEETSRDGKLKDYVKVPYEHTCAKCKSYRVAAHAMIYAKSDQVLWPNSYKLKKRAQILMQMRFDGYLGFPGGFMDKDPNEKPVDALNRELVEEIALDKEFYFSQNNYLMTNVNHEKGFVLHFYAKEVTPEQFTRIEKAQMEAEEWGVEAYGTVQVPLFLFKGEVRGFPAFLTNRFIGNSKAQLIYAIQEKKIIPEDDFNLLMSAYRNYIQQSE